MSTALVAGIAGRFALQDTIPDDIKSQGLVRFVSLLRVSLVLHLLGFGLNWVGVDSFGWAPGCSQLGAAEHLFGFVMTVGFLIASARSRHPDRVLNAGLAYQVVTCFVAAFAEQAQPTGRISVVAILILIFPLFVPRSVMRTWVSGTLSAAVAPLAYYLYQLAGVAESTTVSWDTEILLQLGANFVFAGLAVVPSRVMASLTHEVRNARHMGAYELVEKLGAGGMGEVWRARHSLLRRPAAIKLVSQDSLDGPEREKALQRFEREAQATATLESPHTVELYDFGVAPDGSLFYVMELLNGITLEQYVKKFGAMSAQRVVFVLEQICDSLDDAHERGLVHRDIKPANIMLCKRGRRRDFVKVVDFGLVRPTFAVAGNSSISQTAEGQIRGTPAYLSPEAVTGDKAIGARSDIYALGCVAYYLLTGKLVFDAESPVKMAIAHAVKKPQTVAEAAEQQIPDWLSELVMKMLAKDPEARPETALQILEELREGELPQRWTQQQAAQFWCENLQKIELRRHEKCSPAAGKKRCCEFRMGVPFAPETASAATVTAEPKFVAPAA